MALKTDALFPLTGNIAGKGEKAVPSINTGKNPLPSINEKAPNPSLIKETTAGTRLPPGQGAAESAKGYPQWVTGLTQTLGLPQDTLSYTLLTLARLFSLKPDPASISNLRKEALASGSSTPKSSKEKAALEAKALALLAAADKGVVLSKESLTAYAALPDRDENQRQGYKPWNFTGEQPDAEDLKRQFGNSGGNSNQKETKDDFLDFLNMIPGKNSRRWIVWPFNYAAGGTELRVLLRILIEEPLCGSKKSPDEALCFMDIAGPRRNWRFLLSKTGEKQSAVLSIIPGLPPADIRIIKKELIKELGLNDFRIRNGEELPLAEELGAPVLPSLNEEV